MFDKWCSKLCFALATKLYEGRRREERELKDCRPAELPIVPYTLMGCFLCGLVEKNQCQDGPHSFSFNSPSPSCSPLSRRGECPSHNV